MASTYDLTLKLRADQSHSADEVIADVFDPVLLNGVLMYTLPDGKTIIRSMIHLGHVYEVEQKLSGTASTPAQDAGDYRDVEKTYYGGDATLDGKASNHSNVKFDVVVHATGSTITINGALAIEVEEGTLRVKPASPADTYRLFCLHGPIDYVEVTPQVT